MKRRLCVFCGAKPAKNKEILNEIKKLATIMDKFSMELVYGGASVGVMGNVAEACLEKKIKVIGVMPKSIVEMEVAHSNLSEFIKVDNMHTRKEKMYELSDIFLAMPGGFGTLDELFEILTWRQLKFHQKKIFVLNFNNYFSGLKIFIDNAVKEGLITVADSQLITFIDKIEQIDLS